MVNAKENNLLSLIVACCSIVFIIFTGFFIFISIIDLFQNKKYLFFHIYRNIKRNLSVTFCTLPNNITDDKDFYIKLLPFRSWLMAFPSVEVLFLGNISLYDPKRILVKTLSFEFPSARLKTYPVDLGLDGRPYIKSWFQNAVKYATSDIVIVINNDIIIKKSFFDKFNRVLDSYDILPHKRQNPLYVGDRIESFRIKPIDHHLQYEELKNYVIPKYYMKNGCDYFVFYSKYPPFDFSVFPPYVAGLFRWDNHFLCLSFRATHVISMNPYIEVFHINHYRKRDNPDAKTVKYMKYTDELFQKGNCWSAHETSSAKYKVDMNGNLISGPPVKTSKISFDH